MQRVRPSWGLLGALAGLLVWLVVHVTPASAQGCATPTLTGWAAYVPRDVRTFTATYSPAPATGIRYELDRWGGSSWSNYWAQTLTSGDGFVWDFGSVVPSTWRLRVAPIDASGNSCLPWYTTANFDSVDVVPSPTPSVTPSATALPTSCPPNNAYSFGNSSGSWSGLTGTVVFAVFVSKAYTPEGLSLRITRADGVELQSSVRTAPVDAGDYWKHEYTWNTGAPGYDFVGRLYGRCRSSLGSFGPSTGYAEFTTANFPTPTPTASETTVPSATATSTATAEPSSTPTTAPSATATAAATEAPTYTPTAAATSTPAVDVAELIAAVNRQTAVMGTLGGLLVFLVTGFGLAGVLILR